MMDYNQLFRYFNPPPRRSRFRTWVLVGVVVFVLFFGAIARTLFGG